MHACIHVCACALVHACVCVYIKRLGLDCPVFPTLRDNRLIRYKDSLLAMIQTDI